MDYTKDLHPLLRRAIIFLENEEWGSADDYCERYLDENPEFAYAYVIKIMARVHVAREEDLAKQKNPSKIGIPLKMHINMQMMSLGQDLTHTSVPWKHTLQRRKG